MTSHELLNGIIHVIDSWPPRQRGCAHFRLLPQLLPAGNGGTRYILYVKAARDYFSFWKDGLLYHAPSAHLCIRVQKNSTRSVSENYKVGMHINVIGAHNSP